MSKNSIPQTQVEFDPETGFVSEIFDEVKPAATLAQPGTASLEQVREILFGPHSRDLEQRVSRVEEKLDRSLAELTAQNAARIENLERHVKDELTTLLEQLSTQRDELLGQVNAIMEDVEERSGALSQELALETGRLRSEVVDRATLADLLTETALRLADPSHIPGLATGPLDDEFEDLTP